MNIFTRTFLTPVLDFIYPPVCFTCNRMLAEGETRVCNRCWGSFVRVTPDHPIWQEIEQRLSGEIRLSGLVSSYLFEKNSRLSEVIHLLKYSGIKSLGTKLGREIGDRFEEWNLTRGIDYLIPVPLHPLKKRERGYNQAEIIARGISEVTRIPVDASFLVRKKYTASQTRLDRSQRLENVAGAFAVRQTRMMDAADRSFVLVDDVITTGATIGACMKILKSLGAAGVYASSVALAQ